MKSKHYLTKQTSELALVQFRTGPMTDGIKCCWCMHRPQHKLNCRKHDLRISYQFSPHGVCDCVL